MFIRKYFRFKDLLELTGRQVFYLTLWSAFVVLLYEYLQLEWVDLPKTPLLIIGTAVAFYLGFKNTHAYERLWEARKIWGAIINDSRAFGASVRAYIGNIQKGDGFDGAALHGMHKKLIYRHLAWCYALRSQLLVPTPWEHIRQGKQMQKRIAQKMKDLGATPHHEGVQKEDLESFLEKNELETVLNFNNTATQIIDFQAQEIADLRTKNLINDYYHTKLQDLLDKFYDHQGKSERIKKFPLPRQYGSSSFFFVMIFIILLPLVMITEFHKLGPIAVWLTVPFSVLVSWVYLMMEMVGDYSENPFEGLGNDIPMLAICRTIEIDLKEMLREADIPPPIQAKNGILR